jgi:hypothetical protein
MRPFIDMLPLLSADEMMALGVRISAAVGGVNLLAYGSAILDALGQNHISKSHFDNPNMLDFSFLQGPTVNIFPFVN